MNTGEPTTQGTSGKVPLQDAMLAMDVVDTLRHRQRLVDKELSAGGRREELLRRLRTIYAAQGIEVSDEVLLEGVAALEEERFSYTAPANSLQAKLARLYVSRGSWLTSVVVGLTTVVAAVVAYVSMVVMPAQRAQDELPAQLNQRYEEIAEVARDTTVVAKAFELITVGQQALEQEQFGTASEQLVELDAMSTRLHQSYEVRIVSRPGERSGVWRIPEVNQGARNYYLIVEGIDSSGSVVEVPITSEEDGTVKSVSKWGIRVPENVFQKVAADKSDDGILSQALVGQKRVGYLQPTYTIPISQQAGSGGAITEW